MVIELSKQDKYQRDLELYESRLELWEIQKKQYDFWTSVDKKRGHTPFLPMQDPGPPPVKPTPPTRSPFKKFLDGYIIFSGFTFLAICFCVFAFLMWWLIGILSGSYFMAWLTVILMVAAIPITIHYGMKK